MQMRAFFDAGSSSASGERGTSAPTSIGVARPDAKAVEGGGIIRVGDPPQVEQQLLLESLEVQWCRRIWFWNLLNWCRWNAFHGFSFFIKVWLQACFSQAAHFQEAMQV
jgi:hypothetical protein